MQAILGTMTFGGQADRDTSAKIVSSFKNAGHTHLDTAYVYVKGKTEELLGSLNGDGLLSGTTLATKVNPKEGGLGATAINDQFTTSLKRLGVDSVDLLYLHQPDLNTPIIETLQALHSHHQAGRFKRFGLSNYAAWQVAEIAELCKQHGFMPPVVYQGMYNAFTRDVERELFHCLKHYDMAFYAYNPLAGGLLTGKHTQFEDKPAPGRFSSHNGYTERYWKADYFGAVDTFVKACAAEDIKPAAAALRWMVHHSALDDSLPNGIILGASSMSQFEQNLEAYAAPALPNSVVAALDDGWERVRPDCIKYFRP